MCMVRGGGDILFRALNTGGAVRKKWEGGYLVGQGGVGCIVFRHTRGQTFVHASLTYNC